MNSEFHVVHCADVSADHIISGVLSRGEIVDACFRQLERLVRPPQENL